MKLCRNIQECLRNSDIVVSGIPFSKDGIIINSPYSDEKIEIEQLREELKYKKFYAGGIPTYFYEDKDIENIDLLKIEELAILNAIPTAEGTIKIAIEETENTIHESNIMIIGFGRIGKILCKNFKDLGANIYCTARKEKDLAWIREARYTPIHYNEINKNIYKMDLIINTVPTLVIKEETISKMKKDSLIIDVASNPGGVDKESAKRYKIRVITALGLPGKIAPRTAAKYIKNIIEKDQK